jgi:prolyl oligopeptidase PreP (S9A serine peptidase family)
VGLVVRKRGNIVLFFTTELPIHLKLKKGISSISKPKVDFKVKTSNQTSFYTSKDGTKIPMIITYKRIRN